MSRRLGHRDTARRSGGRGRRTGFTLIEVMIAMSLMVAGTIAIMQLQRGALRANTLGRELSTATLIARNALERLKLDAVTWTAVAPTNAGGNPIGVMNPNVLGDTLWLRQIVGANFVWQRMNFPQTNNPGAVSADLTASPGADFFGRDLPTVGEVADSAHFCTSLRLTWVQAGRTIRADVRVVARDALGGGPDLGSGITNACVDAAGALDPGGARVNEVHAVYASTVLRVNGQPGF